MNPTDEIAQLRKELDALRKRVDEISRFITIETDQETRQPIGMNLRCGVVTFAHPDVPNFTQAYIGASADGPYILMNDRFEKPRIYLGMEKDQPSITLRNAAMQDGVVLSVEAIGGRGMAAVFDNGKPRALMKAAPDGSGCVSVLHDDGQSRIALRADATEGVLFAISSDLRTAVKIRSDYPLGGGLITVHGPGGEPSVILSHTNLGGAVLLNGPDGKPIASLPDAGFGKKDDDGGEEL